MKDFSFVGFLFAFLWGLFGFFWLFCFKICPDSNSLSPKSWLLSRAVILVFLSSLPGEQTQKHVKGPLRLRLQYLIRGFIREPVLSQTDSHTAVSAAFHSKPELTCFVLAARKVGEKDIRIREVFRNLCLMATRCKPMHLSSCCFFIGCHL